MTLENEAARRDDCMPAHSASGISRRSVLMNTVVGVASIASATAIPAAAGEPHDAELFELEGQLYSAQEAWKKANAAYSAAEEKAFAEVESGNLSLNDAKAKYNVLQLDAWDGVLCYRFHNLLDRMLGTRARTLNGLLPKIRVIRFLDTLGHDRADEYLDELMNDIEAIAGAAGGRPALPALSAAAAGIEDAELIDAGEKLEVSLQIECDLFAEYQEAREPLEQLINKMSKPGEGIVWDKVESSAEYAASLPAYHPWSEAAHGSHVLSEQILSSKTPRTLRGLAIFALAFLYQQDSVLTRGSIDYSLALFMRAAIASGDLVVPVTLSEAIEEEIARATEPDEEETEAA